MKILVTGGAGFIGSHIVDAYINDGHEVLIIDNLSTGKRANINSKAKLFECDICSEEAHKIVEKERPEILNHHAAQIDVRISVNEPLNDIRVNLIGLVNILEAARKSGLKKIIFSSSGGAVYGNQEIYPAAEDHSTSPINPYGLNKLMCEKYLGYYHDQFGISHVALRYSNVYGPRQNFQGEAGVVAVFLSKMFSNEQPVINGDGKQTRDYIYVSDVVDANRLALTDKAYGTYNVGTGIETDVNAVFGLLKEFTGSSCKEIHGPAKPGEQQRSAILSHKISKELGWRVTVPFHEGMKLTFQWFKDKHK